MAPLPSILGEQTVRAFQRAGWFKDRQHGSHVIPIKPGNPVSLSVPQHRELAPGTLLRPDPHIGDAGGPIPRSTLTRPTRPGLRLFPDSAILKDVENHNIVLPGRRGRAYLRGSHVGPFQMGHH
ncbi:MAG: type II toxin-antitoxin system HicA family toxin [Bryobacteraceae bacterium]